MIEPWKVNASKVHCHEIGFNDIHCYQGSLVTGSCADFIAIGLLSGRIKRVSYVSAIDGVQHEAWSFIGDCLELCQMITDVLAYDACDITGARENLEDADVQAKMSDFEVAYLDRCAREILADEAREAGKPFSTKSVRVAAFLRHNLRRLLR